MYQGPTFATFAFSLSSFAPFRNAQSAFRTYQPVFTNLYKTLFDLYNLATWPEQLTISRRIRKSGNGFL